MTFDKIYSLIIVSFIISLFIFWLETKKDGFQKNKAFDLFFSQLLLWGIFNIFLKYILDYFHKSYFLNFEKIAIYSFFILLLVLSYLFTKKWHWSIYRILDIFSFSGLLLTSFFVLFKLVVSSDERYVYLLLVLLFVFVFLHTFRNVFFSGLTFLVFCLVWTVITSFMYTSIYDLIFMLSLFTIGLVFLYKRYRRTGSLITKFADVKQKRKSMLTRNLDEAYIKKQKEILLSKKGNLIDELEDLKGQDPYLVEGRAESNADAIDDAILEDEEKIKYDLRIQSLKSYLAQVNRALTKIDSGDYGICELTGKPIDKARLDAYPEATTSYDVERKAEEVELQ